MIAYLCHHRCRQVNSLSVKLEIVSYLIKMYLLCSEALSYRDVFENLQYMLYSKTLKI